MISLARKALPNSFFSQPCQAEAEGRCICSSSGLCLVPVALLVCPSLFTGWEQWVRNRAVLPFLHRLHIDTWYIFIYTVYTIYIYNIFNIYMVYIKAAPSPCQKPEAMRCFLRAGQELELSSGAPGALPRSEPPAEGTSALQTPA